MKAIVMNGAGDIDMLEYVERPDPSQPAQPAQPAQQSSPRSPGSRSAGGRRGAEAPRAGRGRVEKGLSFSYTPEVLEAEEAFGKGQKGSSAMPHKKNPTLLLGLLGQIFELR